MTHIPKQLISRLAISLLILTMANAQAALESGIDKSAADPSVRIQDNLFEAVNGGWKKRTAIPSDESSVGVLRSMFDLTQTRSRELVEQVSDTATPEAHQVRAMYRSFMDLARVDALGLKPVAPQMAQIDAVGSKAALLRLLGSWQGQGVSLPFALYVNVDDKDPSRYLAGLGQDGLAMPDRDYYLLSDARFLSARKAYLAYLKSSFKALGLSQPEKRAGKVMVLETAIARAQWDNVANRDPVKTYNKLTREMLGSTLPGIDWDAFLGASGAAGLEALNVNQPSYLAALAGLLADQPLAAWQDYLRIRVLDAYGPYLDSRTAARQFGFHGTTLNGMATQRPRWKRGLRLVNETVGESLGKLYVAKYFPPEYKVRMQEMIRNLLAAYDADIDTLSWMGEQSRRGAHEKIAKLMVKIGYPDKWRGFDGLELDEKDLVGNVRRAHLFEYRRSLAEIGKPVDRSRWWMAPQIVNAYYNPTLNEIVFPAAFLQPPFFDMKADDAVNYGAVGTVIGHEISHGFDDGGSQYNADGKLEPWMAPEDRERFKALTQRLIEQYNKYEALPGKFVKGELTLGENIADNAGLAIAYKAYRLSLAGKPAPEIDGMSGDQRFFIGFAQSWRGKSRPEALLSQIVSDPHSPDEFRVLGSAINSDAFHETFGVKQGDGMYKSQDQRIRIW
jgi:putative endopeptidase